MYAFARAPSIIILLSETAPTRKSSYSLINHFKIGLKRRDSRQRLPSPHLHYHLEREDGGKHVVEVLQDVVPKGVLADGVLSGQRQTAQYDNDQNRRLKISHVDDAVAADAYPRGKERIALSVVVLIIFHLDF